MANVMDAVAEIVRDAASLIRQLRSDQGENFIAEKAGNELVTEADRAAEQEIAQRLGQLHPSVRVLGEEAASSDPSLLGLLQSEDALWIVDPVDGTANYAAGRDEWGVMVALLARGRVNASWIYRADTDALFAAEFGSGATMNGERITRDHKPTDRPLRGCALTTFVEEPQRSVIGENLQQFEEAPPSKCAAVEYARAALGDVDFLMYSRVRPWDHLPGSLLAAETSGRSARFDGSPYLPSDNPDRTGLLVTSESRRWDDIAQRLLRGVH